MKRKKPARNDKTTREPVQVKTILNANPTIPFLPGLIVAVTGLVLYLNTVNHGFALDDYSLILENRLTRQGAEAIPEILKTSYRFGYYFTDDNLYRPLVKAMYAMEWEMSPESPLPGHVINILLYACTGVVLFRVLMRLSRNHSLFAFAASILFMVHPVHTEVVANIKSRDEIMAFLFGIAALGTFIKAVDSGKVLHLVSSSLLFFVALLCKESAITFLAVFPLAAWFTSGSGSGKWLMKTVPLAAVAVLFLLIRSAVLGDVETGAVSVADNLLQAAKDPVTRFTTAITILGLYLKLLLIPHPLVFDYSYNQIPLASAGDIRFLVSGTIYTTMLVFAIITLRRKNPFSFFILFYLITLSVSSNLFITTGSSMGERFLFTPSLGFCMAVAGGVVMLSGRDKIIPWPFTGLNRMLLATFGLVIALYSLKTISRNPVWKDNYTLYSNDVLLSPNSTRTHYYLGNYLVKPEAWEGKSEAEKEQVLRRGISELRKSIEIYHGFSDAHLQLGVAYFKLNKPDSAMVCYQEALKINPTNATIHNNIGTVFFTRGDYQQALTAFNKATSLDPRYAEAHANTGSALGMMQRYDEALSSLFNAVKYDPGYAQAYYFIGLTYRFKGDERNAVAYLEKAYSLDPALRPKK
jgi:Flp pilus assembly protein TadD